MEGTIFDIKRFALHDGPGIRTTVFLKGCPLRCAWCHNPESQGHGVETLIGRTGPVTVGRRISVDDVIAEVVRDTAFFDESGGGVTFSGGEPLAQHPFLTALLDRCGQLDIHRAVDTSGHAPPRALLRVAQRTDLFLFDLKLMEATTHERYTGVEARGIWDNLRALCETEVAIEIRAPVVPGITDSREHLAALGNFVRALPRALPVRLLPFHRAAVDKYTRFGLIPLVPDLREPTVEQMERMQTQLQALGVNVCT